jgi:hypothetical protein
MKIGRIRILPASDGINVPSYDVRSAHETLIALKPRPATIEKLAILLGGIKSDYIRYL